MEADELKELRERAEHEEHRPVAFTMSLMAVLVAVTTVLGHRSHTDAVLYQNKATDQWNEYQAKKIRSNDTALVADLMSVVTVSDNNNAQKIEKVYADHQKKWADELKEESEKAEGLEKRVEQAEKRAVRFDLAEALLEIGLVITSVTLLTHKLSYWYFGIAFSAAGIISVITAFFLG